MEPNQPQDEKQVAPRKLAQRAAREGRQSRSIAFWLILFLGGGTVAGLALMAATYLWLQAVADDAIHNADWATHSSEDGWFTVELPGIAEPGSFNPYKVQVGSVVAEVSYEDIGIGDALEIEFDFARKISEISQATTGQIGPTDSRPLDGFEGRECRMGLLTGRHSRHWILRRGNRVYVLSVHNLFEEDTLVASRIFNSFVLTPVKYPVVGDGVLPGPPTMIPDGPMIYREGDTPGFNVEFSSGTPPYKFQFSGSQLPPGIEARTHESGTLVLGGEFRAQGSYSVDVTLTDAAGYVKEFVVQFVVMAR